MLNRLYFLEDFQSSVGKLAHLEVIIDHCDFVEVLISGVTDQFAPSLIKSKTFFDLHELEAKFNPEYSLMSILIHRGEKDLLKNEGLEMCYKYLYQRFG